MMILATILMIDAKAWEKGMHAGDPRVKDTHAGDARAEDIHAGDIHAEGPRAKDARVYDTPVIELGTYGETFPVAERNLLDVIRAKLQALLESGKLEGHQKAILNKAREQLNRPAAVRGIFKTITPKSFPYDPSIVAPYDLKDSKGEVFHRQGARVNPLDTHQMACPLLFVDGDDPEQVFWAIKHYKAAGTSHKPKIILVQGVPLELSKKFNLPVYFDQHGALVKKLGITQVPARVSQAGKNLLVEEVNARSEK